MRNLASFAVVTVLLGGLISAAGAAPVVTQCGSVINSITKTEIGTFETTSEIPVRLLGAGAAINVPAGATRCIRLRFSAIANCPNACFLRAFENGAEMNPAWVSNPLRFSQDATNSGSAHAFEWVKRVGPGSHVVEIKIQTGSTCCTASIGPFTSVIEITR